MPMYFQASNLAKAFLSLCAVATCGPAGAADNPVNPLPVNPLIGKWVEVPTNPEKCRGDTELSMMEFTPNSMIGYSHDKPVFTIPMAYPPGIFEKFRINGNTLTAKDDPDCPMVRK